MFKSKINKRRLVSAVLLSLSIHLPLFTAEAQTTSGTVYGRVLDQSNKGLPGAKVTIVNEDNGNTRATVTDSGGIYTVAFLTPGIYRIKATLDGYNDGAVQGLRVPLNKTTPLLPPPDIVLTPASGPPQVVTLPTATGGPVVENTRLERLADTTDPTRRGNFTQKQIEALPLGGTTDMRTFDELANLLPGVAPPPYTPGIKGPGIGFGIGSAGEFAVNGQRARSNNFTIDGSDNNDPDVGVRRQGFVALVPQPIESINEFEISTLLWDSELGRNLGSEVNAVSRDGGSHYHGEAYGFITDSRLNARNFFDEFGNKPAFTRSQAGVVIGGPVDKKTQFFASFERLDVNAEKDYQFSTPGPSERTFLQLPQFGVLRPFQSALQNEFFATDLGSTPLGRNLLSFYPLPNDPGGIFGPDTLGRVLPASGHGNIFSGKVTRQLTEKSNLSGRYNFTDDNRILPAINNAINSTTVARTRTQDFSLILTTALGPRLSNLARFSYGRTRLRFDDYPGSPLIFSASSTETINTPTGTQSLPSTTGQIGELVIQPFSPVGVDVFTFPQGRVNNSFQYADSISWTRGGHSVKLGADIRHQQLNSFQDRNFRPEVLFGNALLNQGTLNLTTNPAAPFSFTPGKTSILTGAQLASLGLPSSIFQTISQGTPDSGIGLRFTEYNFFFNDNWRVRKNLVVDYGLRYEYNSVPHSVNDRIEDALQLKNLPAPGASTADSTARTTAFDRAVDAYRTILDGRTSIYDPDHNNFAPHIGIAWDPRGNGKTSIRAGYGIYYDAILGAVVSQSRNVFPNLIPVNVDPAFTNFDVFVLNSPQSLIVPGVRGAAPIPLIKPGTVNQFGGGPGDFVSIIGQLFITNGNGGGLAFTLPDKHLRSPYAQSWHLTVEHQLGQDILVSAAYVGTKGTKLTRLTTPNLGTNVTPSVLLATQFANFPPGGQPQFPLVLADCALFQGGQCARQPARPIPALGAFQIYQDSASSNYHALQLEMRKRSSHGYTFTAAYTWSHAIDDVSDVFPISGAPIVAQDAFNLRLERASANYDIRHRIASSVIWDIPITGRWIGGWQASSIFEYNTGQPFTLLVPADSNFQGNQANRPSTTDGLVFLDGQGPRRVAVMPGVPLSSFIVLGQDGAVGRNTARAAGQLDFDVALSKSFKLADTRELRFRAESFNLLNRPNFGVPNGVIGGPGFGMATETSTPGRIIQFALKFLF